MIPMKMSEGVEWALHCVTLLAALPDRAALPARALADYHGVSESYLLKHLPPLAQRGILESIPGPRGGYRLARPAETITFLDIVEAIEGETPAFRCTEIRRRGPVRNSAPNAYQLPCAIHAVMNTAESAWKEALRRQTIGEMAQHLAATLDPQVLQDSGAWLGTHARGGTPTTPAPRADRKSHPLPVIADTEPQPGIH